MNESARLMHRKDSVTGNKPKTGGMAISTFSEMISTVRMELKYLFVSSSELILTMNVEAMREIKPAYRRDQPIYAYANCGTHGYETKFKSSLQVLTKSVSNFPSTLAVALVESGRVILQGHVHFCPATKKPSARTGEK